MRKRESNKDTAILKPITVAGGKENVIDDVTYARSHCIIITNKFC